MIEVDCSLAPWRLTVAPRTLSLERSGSNVVQGRLRHEGDTIDGKVVE